MIEEGKFDTARYVVEDQISRIDRYLRKAGERAKRDKVKEAKEKRESNFSAPGGRGKGAFLSRV